MAIARSDPWGFVQKRFLDQSPTVRLVALPTPTVRISEVEPEWHVERLRRRGAELFGAWERALQADKTRRAARLRAAWLHTLHLDRLAYAREIADERGLRLDPMGRGPVLDQPTVHYRDRLPWAIEPIGRYTTEALPKRAGSVIEAWNGSGWVFDRFYVAEQPVGFGHFPVRCLIGAISPDNRTAEWFVLDRWAS